MLKKDSQEGCILIQPLMMMIRSIPAAPCLRYRDLNLNYIPSTQGQSSEQRFIRKPDIQRNLVGRVTGLTEFLERCRN